MVTIRNSEELPFVHDTEAPPCYRGGVHHFDESAQLTHAVAFVLEPGQAVCPYHYEYGHELWTVVLEGSPTVRTPDGFKELRVGDVMFAPRGPEGTHQLINRSDSRVRLLGFSNTGLGATEYPDSNKVGVWPDFVNEEFVAERSNGVGYFHNETGIDLGS